MLADFVVSNREQIVTRCRSKVAMRPSPPPTEAEIDHGVPMFLEELLKSLRLNLSANAGMAETAATHGRDLLRRGFTASQVVHDYGDICQTITDMAVETKGQISADDFRMLNRCLDDAIAAAITEYQRERDTVSSEKATRDGDQVRRIADALRVSVSGAQIAFESIQAGNVGFNGSTGSDARPQSPSDRGPERAVAIGVAGAVTSCFLRVRPDSAEFKRLMLQIERDLLNQARLRLISEVPRARRTACTIVGRPTPLSRPGSFWRSRLA